MMMEACQVLTFDLPEIEGVEQAAVALLDQVEETFLAVGVPFAAYLV